MLKRVEAYVSEHPIKSIVGTGTLVDIGLVGCFYDKPFAGPLAGAILASCIACGTAAYYKLVDSRSSKNDLCDSLVAEILQLIELIENNRARAQTWNTIEFVYVITENYFSVFSQNAGRLGILGAEVAAKVIRCYMETKQLFDSVRMYSTFSDIFTRKRILIEQMIIAGCTNSSEYIALEQEVQQRAAALEGMKLRIFDEKVPETLRFLRDADAELIRLRSGIK